MTTFDQTKPFKTRAGETCKLVEHRPNKPYPLVVAVWDRDGKLRYEHYAADGFGTEKDNMLDTGFDVRSCYALENI